MNGKRGISLITLIITIIVIIILASAIILSLNNTNIIGNANKAVIEQDKESLIDTYTMLTMDKFVANSTKGEPIGNIDISELYTKIGKDLGDNFKVENNNLLEKQEDGSYDIIAKFPNSGSNGESTPVEPENPNYTREKSNSAYNKPYIPKNFIYVEGTWDTGLVIKNKDDNNEFVWIPVDGKNVEYKKVDFAKKDFEYVRTKNDTIPLASTETNPDNIARIERENVEKYGGFYIGRYEAGTKNKRTTSSNTLQEDLIIQPLKDVYNYVSHEQAKGLAEGLYTKETDCVSGLTTGTQWDTACMFLGKDYADDSTGKGNYKDYDSRNDPGLTGAKKEYSLKNVYDMAGNTWEWINEIYIYGYVTRGGFYNDIGSDKPAGYRNYSLSGRYIGVAFRVSLYIK